MLFSDSVDAVTFGISVLEDAAQKKKKLSLADEEAHTNTLTVHALLSNWHFEGFGNVDKYGFFSRTVLPSHSTYIYKNTVLYIMVHT